MSVIDGLAHRAAESGRHSANDSLLTSDYTSRYLSAMVSTHNQIALSQLWKMWGGVVPKGNRNGQRLRTWAT